MKAWLLHALTTVFIVGVALALYDRGVVRPARIVGVVDVAEVYRSKEVEFTQLLTRTGSDEGRQRALLMARAFAQRLPTALEELPRDCGCLVVLKSAVAGPTPQMIDLTPDLRRKVDAP